MKRDVKVGLFVAGVVCSVAAFLLGGGVVGRSKPPTAPLRLNPLADTAPALPAELVERVLPPVDAAERLVDAAERLRDEIENASDAVDDGELVEAASDVLPTEDLGGLFEIIDDAEVVAGGPASLTGAGTAEDVDIIDLSVEELLTREAEVATTAGGIARGTPALRIAPPARGIAVPPPAKHVYVMKEGDSFWTVSEKIYVAQNAGKYYGYILRANPDVEPKKLRPGDRIAIPDIPGVLTRREHLADSAQIERKRKPRVYLKRDKIHEVQPGETLQDISLKYYGYMRKWPHIVRANLDLDPRKIRPGDKIVVPAVTE